MRRLALAPLLLACALLFAEGRASSPYAIAAIRAEPGKDAVTIVISSSKGWHLNGEGYPALIVTVALSEQPVALSCAGIAEGARHEWTIAVPAGRASLPVEIEAIACGASRCVPIHENKSITIEPRD